LSRTTMIVLLVICAILLIAMIAVIVPRIKNLMARTPTIVYIGVLVALVVIIIVLAINLFGPKGNDSVLSSDAEGVQQGDASVQTQLVDDEGNAVDISIDTARQGNEKGDDTVYLSIRGTEIRIGETQMSSIDVAISTLQQLAQNEMNALCVVDDYAEAGTYREVKERLDEAGIKYREKATQ